VGGAIPDVPGPLLDGKPSGGAFAVARCSDWMEKAVMTSPTVSKCAKTLTVGSKSYVYYSLPEAEKHGLRGISRLHSR